MTEYNFITCRITINGEQATMHSGVYMTTAEAQNHADKLHQALRVFEKSELEEMQITVKQITTDSEGNELNRTIISQQGCVSW